MGPKINLQPRDYLLLTRLCQFGYLNLEFITELIFQTPYKNVSRRLIKLRKLGLISFIRRTDYNGTKVYIPLIKNIQSLVTEEMWMQGQKLCTFQPWFFRLYEHSDQVRYWGLRVLKFWPDVTLNLEYLLDPDDYTRYGKGIEARRKVPDFTIEFEDQDQLAFEIELHPKSSRTYNQIFLSMHQMRRWPVVYLVRTPAIKAKLQKKVQGWSNYKTDREMPPLRFFIKTFEEVQTDEKLSAFLNEIINHLNAEKLAEWEAKQIVEAEEKAKEEKRKEEERLRAPRLVQLNTTSAQTPPPLRSGKGFARVQQDGQGEKTGNTWKNLKEVFWDKKKED